MTRTMTNGDDGFRIRSEALLQEMFHVDEWAPGVIHRINLEEKLERHRPRLVVLIQQGSVEQTQCVLSHLLVIRA